MKRHLVVVGDTLLGRDVDGRVERVAPDAPAPVVEELRVSSRPGGAGLAAALLALDGHPVTLVTALAEDEAGRALAALLRRVGVDVVDLGTDARTPEQVRVRVEGRALFRLDRGGTRKGRIGPLSRAASRALEDTAGVLVSDCGRGLTAHAEVRTALERAAARAPLVWDPHPEGASPVAGLRLVTLNREESARFTSPAPGIALPALVARAERLQALWRARGVCITLGSEGVLLVDEGSRPLAVSAPAVAQGDPCGAGDRFASRTLARLADGAFASEAVFDAVEAASAFVGAGGASALVPKARRLSSTQGPPLFAGAPPLRSLRPARGATELARQVRGLGGTVVATGGCFDLLHPGHVSMLQAARSLGDCLIVCLNSDASVRRVKGPSRPLHDEAARREVLLALGCVDAVELFDEDEPSEALRRVAPDVWVKAADSAERPLPEAGALSGWGGRAVVVPYRQDHSTSRLIEEVVRRASS